MDSFITLDDHIIKVRRSLRFKYLSLRMSSDRGIWINVPYGCAAAAVKSFLKDKKGWIEKNLELYKERRRNAGYKYGDVITTRFLRLIVKEGVSCCAERGENGITLYVPATFSAEELDACVKESLYAQFHKEACRLLPSRVAFWAEKYGFSYGKLTFRNNRSNWGSCSARNNISLNIKLMDFEDDVIDYVILHELCHTVEKNHSERFWKLVRNVCPDYKELRKKLNKR